MDAGAGAIRYHRLALVIAVVAAGTPAAAQHVEGAEPDLALGSLDVRRRIALAEHLHRRQMLYREIGVLEELRLLAPTGELSVWARLRIAVAYHEAGQYGDAVAEYDALFIGRALDGEIEGLARVQRALAMATPIVHEPGHPGADAILAELSPLTEAAGDAGALASYHRARLAVVVGQRDTAVASIDQARRTCGGGIAPCAAVESLAARIDGPGPRRRSPALALAFSAAVPGSGSMYARHWVDGFYYFGLTALSGLGALDVYDRARGPGDQRASFYGLTSLAVTAYLANLVSAYGAAKRYNRVETHRWQERIWAGSDLPLPLSAYPAPAIE